MCERKADMSALVRALRKAVLPVAAVGFLLALQGCSKDDPPKGQKPHESDGDAFLMTKSGKGTKGADSRVVPIWVEAQPQATQTSPSNVKVDGSKSGRKEAPKKGRESVGKAMESTCANGVIMIKQPVQSFSEVETVPYTSDLLPLTLMVEQVTMAVGFKPELVKMKFSKFSDPSREQFGTEVYMRSEPLPEAKDRYVFVMLHGAGGYPEQAQYTTIPEHLLEKFPGEAFVPHALPRKKMSLECYRNAKDKEPKTITPLVEGTNWHGYTAEEFDGQCAFSADRADLEKSLKVSEDSNYDWIEQYIDSTIAEGVPANRIFILGFSNGASFALRVNARYAAEKGVQLGGFIGLDGVPVGAAPQATFDKIAQKGLKLPGLWIEMSRSQRDASKLLSSYGPALNVHCHGVDKDEDILFHFAYSATLPLIESWIRSDCITNTPSPQWRESVYPNCAAASQQIKKLIEAALRVMKGLSLASSGEKMPEAEGIKAKEQTKQLMAAYEQGGADAAFEKALEMAVLEAGYSATSELAPDALTAVRAWKKFVIKEATKMMLSSINFN